MYGERCTKHAHGGEVTTACRVWVESGVTPRTLRLGGCSRYYQSGIRVDLGMAHRRPCVGALGGAVHGLGDARLGPRCGHAACASC